MGFSLVEKGRKSVGVRRGGRIPRRHFTSHVGSRLRATFRLAFRSRPAEIASGVRPAHNLTTPHPEGRPVTDETKPAPAADDPLALAELFAGGEPWLPLLKPVIEARPNAASFIGPKRDPRIVPMRELTFQALKPNPPHKWRVVVF